MKIEMRKFRIGALAEKLGVERFVIRFWEKEFNIRPTRSSGKQRFYTERDLEKFSAIKDLLYDKGFTIAGAKRYLKKPLKKVAESSVIASQVTTMEPEIACVPHHNKKSESRQSCPEELALQMLELQKKLIKLRELL